MKTLLLVCITGWIIGFGLYLYRIHHFKPHLAPTSGIVILTGGKERIKEGLMLLDKNPTSPLIITGVQTIQHLREVAHFPEYESHINLGFKATTTRENALETLEWNQKKGCTSLQIVTSHYHIQRSLLELQNAMPRVKMKPYPVVSHSFRDLRWLFRPKLWHLLFKEYNKYLFVLLETQVKSIIQ